ncbi:MAG TPA: hypothetical protein VMZ29_17525, partial [Candidatus Bathyarchaeia archaeon]|nr:hypothetical protein [Candidatus Bathyarchaeia archaeon]
TIRQYKKENPDGRIAILCHKVDKISPEELVPMLDHIKDSFTDPKYEIRFEPSSIYYPDSLKDLVFALMKEATIDTKRFELITNIGQKIEESEEFQSYKMEHKEDPRIQQLMDFLNPKSEATLPTYGKTSVTLDLSVYDIIEIVLIDKETFSPITGTSSKHIVSPERSMDYIVALKDFKEFIASKPVEDSSTISIVTSSNEKVHGMIVDLVSKYLLITSFEPITNDKTKTFYKLIRDFAQSTETEKIEVSQPVTSPIEKPIKPHPLIEVEIPKTKAPTITPPSIEVEIKQEITPPIVAPSVESTIIHPIEAPIEKDIPLKIDLPTFEVTGEIEKDSKSMFSFLNKLEDDQEKQRLEVIEEKELEVKQPEIVISEPKAAPIPEITKPEPPIEEQNIQPEVKISEKEFEIKKPIVYEPPKIEAKVTKPKSRFLQILDEERKRYKVREVQISSLENGSLDSEKK